MATPAADGKASKTNPSTAIRALRSPAGQMNQLAMSRAVAVAAPQPTASTSLSCWRSTPRARRRRTTIAAAPSPTPVKTSSHPAMSIASVAGRAPARPSGFDTIANGSANRPGRRVPAITSRDMPASRLASAGRQRGEGSRPSGNRSSGRPSSPAVPSPTMLLKTIAAVAPGRCSAACRPTSAYCHVSSWTPVATPVRQKINPIRFCGTREATITPTEVKVSARIRNERPPIPEKMSLGRVRPGPITSSTTVGTAMTTQSAHARTATRRVVTAPAPATPSFRDCLSADRRGQPRSHCSTGQCWL
jgi:hypothetical protein